MCVERAQERGRVIGVLVQREVCELSGITSNLLSQA